MSLTPLQFLKQNADNIARYVKQSSFTDPATILDILLRFSLQKPEYSGFQFKGEGEFSLVLKADKANYKQPIALKIREFDIDDNKEIERIQRENNLIQMFTFCKQLAQVNQSFFLTKKDQSNNVEAYFVEEMELCDENLAEYIGKFKKNKQQIDNDTKILMVIQMLDAINTLHSRNIMHRDIKPQKFLVSNQDLDLPTLKLCYLNYSSTLHFDRSKSFLSVKGAPEYLAPEAQKNQSRLLSDIYAMGIIILELDNTASFDFFSIKQLELDKLSQGLIFEDHKIDRTSILYKLACTFLQPKYLNRSTASQALFMLLEYGKNLKNLQLFSIVTLQQLSSETKFLPLKSEYLASIETLKVLKAQRDDQALQGEIDILLAKYTGQKCCYFRMNDGQVQSILRILLSSGELEKCEFLGVGATGIVFGVYHIKYKRNSVLKICLCNDEKEIAEKLAEISLIQKCQMPYIVKFYEYQFIGDDKGATFVVEEYERCECTLSQFLQEQKELGNVLSDQQKMSMAIQIMDSVNYLHEHSILHRDIKLDNFLISLSDGKDIIVKLSDFDQSAQIEEDQKGPETLHPKNCVINYDKLGSLPFYAPERFQKFSETTRQTDIFSVGLCIAILDNYMTFTELYLCISYYHNFKLEFDNPFQSCIDKINTDSPLYPLILGMLEYSPKKRNELADVISKTSDCVPKYSKSTQKQLKKLPKYDFQQYLTIGEFEKERQDQFLSSSTKLTNLLSLELHFFYRTLNDVEQLSKALMRLINLSSLNLNVSFNQLNDSAVESLSKALTGLTNLSSVQLDLSNNELKAASTESLSKALISLANMTILQLDLSHNSIQDAGAQSLSNGIKQLTNLSSLTLKVDVNQMGTVGAESLSNALTRLTNLSNLNYSVKANSSIVSWGEYLSQALIPLNNLSHLFLNNSYNTLCDAGDDSLSNALILLTNLSSLKLNLESNKLNAAHALSLSKALKALPNLQILDLNLRYNNLSTAGTESLSKAIKRLTNLSSLNFCFGFYILRSDDTESPLQVFKILNNIQIRGFRSWVIDKADTESLSTALTQLNEQSIQLDLWFSSLSTANAESLLKALTTLINLSGLNLYFDFEITGGESPSKALKIMTNLSNLNLGLSSNSLNDASAKSLSKVLTTLAYLINIKLDLKYIKPSTNSNKSILQALLTIANLSNNYRNDQMEEEF